MTETQETPEDNESAKTPEASGEQSQTIQQAAPAIDHDALIRRIQAEVKGTASKAASEALKETLKGMLGEGQPKGPHEIHSKFAQSPEEWMQEIEDRAVNRVRRESQQQAESQRKVESILNPAYERTPGLNKYEENISTRAHRFVAQGMDPEKAIKEAISDVKRDFNLKDLSEEELSAKRNRATLPGAGGAPYMPSGGNTPKPDAQNYIKALRDKAKAARGRR